MHEWAIPSKQFLLMKKKLWHPDENYPFFIGVSSFAQYLFFLKANSGANVECNSQFSFFCQSAFSYQHSYIEITINEDLINRTQNYNDEKLTSGFEFFGELIFFKYKHSYLVEIRSVIPFERVLFQGLFWFAQTLL